MKKGNIVTSILCMLLGAYVIYICMGYPKAAVYGTGAPGPGLWPGIIGGGLIAAGIWVLVTTLRAPEGSLPAIDLIGAGPGRVYITMVMLIVYVVLLPTTGFIPVTVVLMFVLVQWFAKYAWYKTLIISILVTALVYVVFRFVLNVPIDFGMFAI